MKDKSKVNTRNEILTKAMKDRELLSLIKSGRDSIIEKSSTYIKRRRSESKNDYEDRLEESLLVNILAKTINDYSSKLFKKPFSLILDSDNNNDESKIKTLNNFKENFNGYGTNINEFLKNFLTESLWYSQGHIFVDFEYIDGEFQHLISFIDLDCILDFDYTYNKLTYLRFYIIETERDGFDIKKNFVIKEYFVKDKKVFWNDYVSSEDLDKSDDILKHSFTLRNSDMEFSSDEIPLISFYPNSSQNRFNPDLVFKDVAELQLAHMKKIGDKNFLEAAVSKPFLLITGDSVIDDEQSPDENRELTVNSRNAMQLPSQGSDVKWVSAPQNTFETLAKSVADLEEQIHSITNSLLIKKGAITATEVAVNESRNNSTLYSIALMLRKSVAEKAIDYLLDWSNQEIKYETSLTSDFSIETNKAEIKEFLDSALVNNVISRKTYLKEMQKRGIIDEEISYDEEQDLIKQSSDIYDISKFESEI